MRRLFKIIWGVVGIVGVFVTIGFVVKDAFEIGQLGLPTPAWAGIGLAIFFISIFALVWGQHKDNEKQKENNEELKKQMQTLRHSTAQVLVEREPTLKEEFQKAKVAWALWYAGTKARADKVLDVKIPTRILLLKPDENSDALLRVIKEAETPLDEILADIRFLTRRALCAKGRVQVGWFYEYIGYTLTIYDTNPQKGPNNELTPNSDEAWLVRSSLDPRVGAGERTRERIYNKGKDTEKFQAYLAKYKEVWERRITVKLVDNEPVIAQRGKS